MKSLVRSLLAVLCLAPPSAWANTGFSGELDLEGSHAGNTPDSLDAAFGERERWNQDFKLRLMWSGALASGWTLDAAYFLDASHGGDVTLARRQREAGAAFYIDPDRTSLLRLSDTLSDHGQTTATQCIDRLALSYSGDHLVFRAGRQALTWGSGLVFHPMDLFNPFPPNATYTAYKSGADMIYGQWLFDSGADFQGVVVPRRDPATSQIESDESSAGLKWHGFVGDSQQLGVDLLLARDYRTKVFGAGLSGAAGGASWSAEAIPAWLDDGDLRVSALANMQYAWTWGGKNVNGYIEFFHNGFGVSGSGNTLAELPAPLTERLARGELFTVSKNYLTLGADLQWTPLLTLKPSVISNLDDGSALLIGQAVYSVSQNTSLTTGLQWGVGGHDTEYGGLETAPYSGIYTAPADRVYARLNWYF